MSDRYVIRSAHVPAGYPSRWEVYDTRTERAVEGEEHPREDTARRRAIALNHAWERTR